MSTRVDIENVEATKSEKLLAVVLAVFLLIGGVWAYVKIDDYARDAIDRPALSVADQTAIDRYGAAQTRESSARIRAQQARRELELRREAYRTALDAGRPARALEREYERAQAAYEDATRELAAARAAVESTRARAAAAFRAEMSLESDAARREALFSFLGRFLLTVGSIAGGFWLLSRLRRRRSRWLALGFAAVGYATVLSLVLASDYVTDYVDPLDLGPLVLSLFGIGATMVAFWALQRYLARRLPARRAGKGECPYCGYPVRDRGPHCEGCGRTVVAPCSNCSSPRRVGVVHCATCGAKA